MALWHLHLYQSQTQSGKEEDTVNCSKATPRLNIIIKIYDLVKVYTACYVSADRSASRLALLLSFFSRSERDCF